MAKIKRKWMPSPSYHSRGGIKPYKIILHTAEGATTIESLGNFFANGSNQVSSHTGADDKKDILGEYVTRGNAAWTQAAYNEEAVSLELCGFAKWSRSTWLNQHSNMLHNAARWVAEEAAHYGIPIVALNNSQAQGGGRGVCEHVNLGSGGGGHVDCGSGFPMDKIIEWAKGGGKPEPKPEPEEDIVPFYLADRPNSPVSLPRQRGDTVRRVRLFCNEAEATIKVDFVAEPEKEKGTLELVTDYNLGPQGCDIPDWCNALVLRRGDEPAGGYPLVSVEILT
jgi:hypothetical protein